MQVPKDFLRLLEAVLPQAETETYLSALDKASPTSLRINTNKRKSLAHLNIDQPVPWCASGFYLPERPKFYKDPFWHAGAYYVQEAGSMFLEVFYQQFLKDKETIKILDACAAPGGKTTHALDYFSGRNFLLFANEFERLRADILRENLNRWGAANTVVTSNKISDYAKYCKDFFDLIILDVPCSGEGMFRKEPQALTHWSMKNVQQCCERSLDLLANAWESLTEDGFLIYSTCTHNALENEAVLEKFTTQHEVCFLALQDVPESVKIYQQGEVIGYRFFPHHTASEGFFVSFLQKKENTNAKTLKKQNSLLKEYKNFLPFTLHAQQKAFTHSNWGIFAFKDEHIQVISPFIEHLYVLQLGIPLGEVKGNDFVVHAASALAQEKYVQINLPKNELELADSLRYLQGDNHIATQGQKGYQVIRYQGLNLGWVKHIDNRCNNLYPKPWRIKNIG
jgi:16S rRNA C967 or C1407 C5-methylase (RsmB/RsmF family)/NOL1/NOP2/fmu family ribosome biogenesis protein